MADVYPYEFPPGEPERSIADVMKEIVAHVQEIVRSELLLARVEMREKISAIGKAGAVLGAGAALVFYALGFLFVAIYNALAAAMAPWIAALIMFIGLGLISGVLIMMGVKRIRRVSLTPARTIQVARKVAGGTAQTAKARMNETITSARQDAKETVETARQAARDSVETVKEEAKWIRNQTK